MLKLDFPVHFSAVAYLYHDNQQSLLPDRVKDAVISNSDPIEISALALQGLNPERARIILEGVYFLPHAFLHRHG